MEVNKILKNAFKYSDWPPFMYAEADNMCYRFAKNYNHIKNRKELYEFLHTVCNYLYFSRTYNKNRIDDPQKARDIVKEHCILGVKYCDIFIEKFPVEIITSQFYLPNIYLYKTHFLVDLDRHIDAYYANVRSMEISRERNLPTSVSIAYCSMAYIVGVLDLSDQALANYDSAFAAIKNEPETDKWVVGQRVYLRLCKQLAFLSKYRKTNQKQWADSVFKMYELIKLEDRQFNGSVEAECNVAIAAVEYDQRNYLKTISRIDSAFKIYPDLFRLGSADDGAAYKALSVLKLGDEQAARSLLETLNFSKLTDPVMVKVLEELYQYEKQIGNLDKSIEYHEQLLGYIKKKASLDLKGKALDMEQFYRVKQKEQQILLLEGAHRQNLIVAGFLVLIVSCTFIIFIIRNRNNQLNTKKLIRQIDEITQSQVVLIEEAEENERKRMAQNLHDDIAGSIATCVNYLRMLSTYFTGDVKICKDLKSVADMMEDSYDMVRKKSHSLSLSGGNREFIDKLEEQVNLLTIGANMNVHLHTEFEGISILTEVKTTILLILKEAITNIIKHSIASQVQVLLYLDVDQLVLEIIDNGKGFDDRRLTLQKNCKTLGFKTMQERTRKLKGTLKISSAIQKGVSILVSIPLKFATRNESV
jgi:signal transduction histidine kinase